MVDDDDFDNDGNEEEAGEALRGPALEKSIAADKNIGKSSKVGNADVEEAIATQKRRSGYPFPYESGYGRTGKKNAELEEYHRQARENGTTLGTAMHDLAAAEAAFAD